MALTKTALGEALLTAKKPGVIVAQGLPTLPLSSGRLLVVNKGVAPEYDRARDDPPTTGRQNQSSLMVMDLATGVMTKRIPLADQSHEIAVGPDAKTAVLPHFVATVPGHGRQPGSAVTVVDVDTGATKRISLPGYTGAHGVEWIDADRVAVTVDSLAGQTEQSFVVELNVRTGAMERAIPTGQEESHLVRLSPDRRTYFVSDLMGSFSSIDRASGVVKRTRQTGDGTEGFDVSPDGKEVWVAARGEDRITIVDAKTLERRAQVRSRGGPIRVRFTPDGKQVLVTDRDANALEVFDAKSRRSLARVDLMVPRLMTGKPQPRRDSGAMMFAFNPEANQAYVAHSHAGVVSAFDTRSWQHVGFLKAGAGPDPLAYL